MKAQRARIVGKVIDSFNVCSVNDSLWKLIELILHKKCFNVKPWNSSQDGLSTTHLCFG
jgi:hypothetical protein